MPVNPTYPGVYVLEVPSGVRTIAGVSTSITLFVGMTQTGPMKKAIRLTTYSDFVRTFGESNTISDMTRQLRLFFMNGGTDCYVIRIANGATAASVVLRNEANSPTLELRAKNPGVLGNNVRAAVTYAGAYPESTFNIELFRWEVDSRGQRAKADREEWISLSMDPASPNYAPTFLSQKSALVNAFAIAAPAPPPAFSLSGRPVVHGAVDSVAAFTTAWTAMIGNAIPVPPAGDGPLKNRVRISVDGSPYVELDFSGFNVATITTGAANVNDAAIALSTAIEGEIFAKLSAIVPGVPNPPVDVTIDAVAMATPDNARLLRITALPASTKDIRVLPANDPTRDASMRLMLGEAQGGTEVGAYASRRPAPTGITFRASDPAALIAFGGLAQDAVGGPPPPAVPTQGLQLTELDASGVPVTVTVGVNLDNPPNPGPPAKMWQDVTGGARGIREKWGYIRDAVNSYQAANPSKFFWRADVWGSRLALIPIGGEDTVVIPFTTTITNIATQFTKNVRHYSLGTSGVAGFQTPGTGGFDGTPPLASDYRDAYLVAETDIDLFNLMVLPRHPNAAGGAALENLWGEASILCQKERAFLIMEAPPAWATTQDATSNIDALRIGLVKDYSAVYFPRIAINEDGILRFVGPTGALAGLYARQDNNRGVWKAPAGTEADIRGIVGVDVLMSDAQNGQLNPVGVNAIRVFPDGVVSWGARTNAGADAFASEYKYVPIRRLALFIEESLYRGLKWVVFEPNDEGLWAQIRLNVGAFMHNLFRQGAFQGQKPNEAYFVKCDAETTTQNDRNLGIVNIWVGFAPLKPAEFVILYLQQIAGQIQT